MSDRYSELSDEALGRRLASDLELHGIAPIAHHRQRNLPHRLCCTDRSDTHDGLDKDLRQC